ncbi:MAG: hypothetical protein AAF623_03875 [Planctomycetota bacterium]
MSTMKFNQIRLFCLLFAAATLLLTDSLLAQPGGRGRPGGGGGPGGGGFFRASPLDLLRNENVQKELELVDEQVEKIMEIADEMNQEQRDYFMGIRDRMRDLDESERREMFDQLREEVTEMRSKYSELAEEELLPLQVERLKQLTMQAENRRGGGPENGQMSDSLAEELGLSEEQIEKLKSEAEKVQPELAKKIAKLRSQATEQILASVLDDDQLARYKELMGDSFDFGDRNRGGGFGGGDRRGGNDRRGGADRRGGDRRGGGRRPGNDDGESDFN